MDATIIFVDCVVSQECMEIISFVHVVNTVFHLLHDQINLLPRYHYDFYFVHHDNVNQQMPRNIYHVTNSSLVVRPQEESHLALQWRHNGRDGVSNYEPHHRLLNCLFMRRSKTASKLRVTGLCEGNSSVTSEFTTQRASKAESASFWWRHHEVAFSCFTDGCYIF